MKARPNVAFHKATGRWCAYVNLLDERHHLGLFDTPALAEAAALEFKTAHDVEIDQFAPLAERVLNVDGALIWRQHGRGHSKGEAVGCVDKISGYRFTRDENGVKVYAHRLVWELVRGPIQPGMQIDHINGQRDDNRLENLRLVTHAVNMKNTRLRAGSATGCPGVSTLPSGRFLARIGASRLGSFATREEAISARKAAEPARGFHPNHGRIEQ